MQIQMYIQMKMEMQYEVQKQMQWIFTYGRLRDRWNVMVRFRHSEIIFLLPRLHHGIRDEILEPHGSLKHMHYGFLRQNNGCAG